jgi:tetratricopeptide (TPR) repeat protein
MELSDKGKLVEVGLDLGEAYQKNGDRDKALEILHVTLDLNKQGAYRLELIHRIYEDIGDIYYESDNYKKAAESYMAAAIYAKPYNQEESDKTEEEWREIQARNSYWAGECYYMIDGELAAVPNYKEALQSYEMLGNEEKVAFINLRLGTIYSRFSDGRSEALEYFKQARDYYVRPGIKGHEELALINESMGYLYIKMRNYSNAMTYLGLAQVGYENLKDYEGRDRMIESIQQVRKIWPYI